jgi:uncharacterized protein YciI
MKHFIIEITYTVPLEQIEQILPAHRAYIQSGYGRGLFLCSGPQVPRVGGIVVARAQSREEIESFFAEDPYNKNGAASYRIVEINPVMWQPLLEDWLT